MWWAHHHFYFCLKFPFSFSFTFSLCISAFMLKGGVCPGWNKPFLTFPYFFLDQPHTNTSFQITDRTMWGPNIMYLTVCIRMSMSFWMQIRKIILFHQRCPGYSIINILKYNTMSLQYDCSTQYITLFTWQSCIVSEQVAPSSGLKSHSYDLHNYFIILVHKKLFVFTMSSENLCHKISTLDVSKLTYKHFFFRFLGCYDCFCCLILTKSPRKLFSQIIWLLLEEKGGNDPFRLSVTTLQDIMLILHKCVQICCIV